MNGDPFNPVLIETMGCPGDDLLTKQRVMGPVICHRQSVLVPKPASLSKKAASPFINVSNF